MQITHIKKTNGAQNKEAMPRYLLEILLAKT